MLLNSPVGPATAMAAALARAGVDTGRNTLNLILDRYLAKNGNDPARCSVACAKELAERQSFPALLVLVLEALTTRAAEHQRSGVSTKRGSAPPPPLPSGDQPPAISTTYCVSPEVSHAGRVLRGQPPHTRPPLRVPTKQQNAASVKVARDRIFYGVIPGVDIREMMVSQILALDAAAPFIAKLKARIGNATDRPRKVREVISDRELRALIKEHQQPKE